VTVCRPADDVRSCTDATDSSGTLTNDDVSVAPRTGLSSIAGPLQLSAAEETAAAEQGTSTTWRCSACSHDQTVGNAAVGNAGAVAGSSSQVSAEPPPLSDEERRCLDLQRSHGAIPKCRSDRRSHSHSGNCWLATRKLS